MSNEEKQNILETLNLALLLAGEHKDEAWRLKCLALRDELILYSDWLYRFSELDHTALPALTPCGGPA